jgi:hypothetical protein
LIGDEAKPSLYAERYAKALAARRPLGRNRDFSRLIFGELKFQYFFNIFKMDVMVFSYRYVRKVLLL